VIARTLASDEVSEWIDPMIGSVSHLNMRETATGSPLAPFLDNQSHHPDALLAKNEVRKLAAGLG
jgi:hypothetical protein